jgi:hypothetical protein
LRRFAFLRDFSTKASNPPSSTAYW